MPKRTNKTALVIIPPEEVWPAIQAIRQEHDAKLRRWMPHLTLVYPFVPAEQFERAATVFNTSVRELPAFDLELKQFESFDHGHGNSTLWLSPEPADPLVELQGAILSALGWQKQLNRFTPHLSVGQSRGRGACRMLMDRLQQSWVPLRFRVSEVSLIWRNDPPDDVFRVRESIPLSKF